MNSNFLSMITGQSRYSTFRSPTEEKNFGISFHTPSPTYNCSYGDHLLDAINCMQTHPRTKKREREKKIRSMPPSEEKEYEVNRGEKGTRKKRNQTEEEKKDRENERKRKQSILHPIKSNSPR